jgi:hypothetical protein
MENYRVVFVWCLAFFGIDGISLMTSVKILVHRISYRRSLSLGVSHVDISRVRHLTGY